ncbi:hypothetical protein Bca4012_027284 [Brassica carinata]
MMMSGCDAEEEASHRKKPKLSSSGLLLPLLPEEMVLKNLIYLCLRIPQDPNPSWFTLSLKALDWRLVPVRSYFYQPLDASSMVAHGCGIYVMGGRIGRRASSSVMILDCRSNTWTTLPSMGVARYSAAAGVVDGKIYILGGCDDRSVVTGALGGGQVFFLVGQRWQLTGLYRLLDFSSGVSFKYIECNRWGEVFDPKKQIWDALPMPPPHSSLPSMYESIVIKDEEEKEKLVAMNGARTFVSYIPSESKWKKGGRILWCEAHEWERPETTDVMEWREVMGLESLRETLAASKLVNYGGRLGDLWESNKPIMLAAGFEITELDEEFPGHKLSNSGNNMLIFWDVLAPNKLEIWCAEVSLDRHKETCEIRGNIVWSEAIMTLDPPPNRLHCQILYALPLNL